MSAFHSFKSCSNKSYNHAQRGFTLIELMVALVLGLIISAAAFQLFANSANSTRVQAAVSDIQDATVFSMSYMKKEIAMANLGAYTPMTQQSAWTGVVLTDNIGSNNDPRMGNLRGVDGNNLEKFVTLSGSDTGNPTTDSQNNVTIPEKSDQLTIQYQAPFNGTDCEGKPVTQGDMIIERFFTRLETSSTSGGTADSKLDIVLACDAGHYQIPEGLDPNNITSDPITIEDFGDAGVILINRVDDFEVQLGVQRTNGIEYLSIDEYTDNSVVSGVTTYNVDASIVAIRLGLIVRGNSPVSGATNFTYKVNGNSRTIDKTSPSYVRRVYQSVVNLRNSGGVS